MFNISNRRYTGSKLKLADWIIELINQNCIGDSFFEIFAGTSIISSKIAPQMKSVFLNDTLEANKIIYEAFYGAGNYNLNKLINIKNDFINFQSKYNLGWFSENYKNTYFSETDCKKIENLRDFIENKKDSLTLKEYAILLASLIYSMDKCANTVGHFDAYIRSDCVADKFEFDLIQPYNFKDTKFTIYSEDANIVAEKIYADIIYIDPPYNSRQYCQFYHIYETIARWDNPELFGTALKPQGRHLSDYCRTKAPVIFEDLISKLKCKYLVASYNNTYESKSSSSRNKINLEEIENILKSRGEIKIFSQKHNFFNAGKTDFSNHKEFLFIVKVK